MFPLIQIGEFFYPVFGIAHAIGITTAFFLIRRNTQKIGYTPFQGVLLFILFLAAFWLGGKLGDIILYGGAFDFTPFQDSGSTVLGSIFMVMVVILAFAAIMKRNWRQLADAIAVPLLIAQISGKIGCFFAGCCFGTHTDLPWAITPIAVFPPNVEGAPIHPVQLYEVFGMLLLLAALHVTPVKQRSGATAGFYLVCYGAIRFLSEFLRGDTQAFYLGITNGQALAMLLVLFGALLLVRIYRVTEPKVAVQS